MSSAERISYYTGGAVGVRTSMADSDSRWLVIGENAIRESIVNEEISIHHISGKRNPADIFTKELKDASHFCMLRDSFMLQRDQFDSLSVGS